MTLVIRYVIIVTDIVGLLPAEIDRKDIMISYIKGKLVDVYEDRAIVELNGMGFEIYIPATTSAHLPLAGSEVCLHTYLYVREDAMMLYGFHSKDALEIFKKLITVSGIGPKGALAILSVITPSELRLAVAVEDAKAITRAPGIGIKTAKKMIIELKDKLKAEATVETDSAAAEEILHAEEEAAVKLARMDSVEALLALGYGKSEAQTAVDSAMKDLNGSDDAKDVDKVLSRSLNYLL